MTENSLMPNRVADVVAERLELLGKGRACRRRPSRQPQQLHHPAHGPQPAPTSRSTLLLERQVQRQLEAHVGEMELLLLEVSKAVSGTLDLPEQLETLGHHVCTRFRHQRVLGHAGRRRHPAGDRGGGGDCPAKARGMRFHLGEGVFRRRRRARETFTCRTWRKEARYSTTRPRPGPSAPSISVSLRKRADPRVMNFNRRAWTPSAPGDPAWPRPSPRRRRWPSQRALVQQTPGALRSPCAHRSAQTGGTLPPPGERAVASLRFGTRSRSDDSDLDLFKRESTMRTHTVGDGCCGASRSPCAGASGRSTSSRATAARILSSCCRVGKPETWRSRKTAARRGGRFDARRGPAAAVVGHHLLGLPRSHRRRGRGKA